MYDRQMEPDELNRSSPVNCDSDSRSAVNSLVLDYYKKFGRKRDLEHYFSLSTAQSELRDPSGLFWRRMKTTYDSDSGEKRSESSTELCRISIKCSVPDESSCSQNENIPSEPNNENNESNSPPIVNEERAEITSQKSDNDSLNSEDNVFQKSSDNILDTSTNKALSPTSSINSQRKLEWDSLADVGYANGEDQRTSMSTLSTLERLALQYSNSDSTKLLSNIGPPTAHSTPLEENQPNKSKTNKKHLIKSTKYCKKDVDFVEVNVPENTEKIGRAIKVSLTKNISFNITDNDRVVKSENAGADTKITTPNMVSVETEVIPELKFDKEIQTSLTRCKSFTVDNDRPRVESHRKKSQRQFSVPVMINLNTLRRRVRNKKIKTIRKKTNTKDTTGIAKEDSFSLHDKSGAPVSEAESFEYMPGHMYNQNQQRDDYNKNKNSAGNKSSLESSSRITTESSKGSNYSFTRELERSIDQLKKIVDQRQKDTNIKKYFVKEIINTIVRGKFREDDSGPDLFVEPSLNSKVRDLCQGDYTTSNSDQNTVTDAPKHKPKKSILRRDVFDTNVASTTQSVPNLSSLNNTDKPMTRKLEKKIYSNSESDGSNRSKQSSELTKTSSEELFLQYIKALRKEQAYKKYLKEKEKFLKQKLTGIEYPPKRDKSVRSNQKTNSVQELMKDLSLNNYDGGSGDANGFENDYSRNKSKFNAMRKQRSHSVFTLSTEQSNKKAVAIEKVDMKNLQESLKLTEPKTQSKDLDDQCCPQHCIRKSAINISEQVNIAPTHEDYASNRDPNARCKCRLPSQTFPGDIKYVCLCTEVASGSKDCSDNVFVYKCSCLGSRRTFESHTTDPITLQCGDYKHQHGNDFQRNIKTVKGNANTDSSTKPMKTSTLSQRDQKVTDIVGHKCSYESVCSGTSSARENESEYKDESKKQKFVVQYTKRKKEPIAMCSRQIQTDLIIDLKASDPTLSDAQYIYDGVRVKAKQMTSCKIEDNCDQKLRKNKYVTHSDSSSSTEDSKRVEVSRSNSRLSLQSRLSVEDFISELDIKKSSETICGIKTAEASEVTIFPGYSGVAVSRENVNDDENKNLKLHVQDTDMMVMIENENEKKTLDIPAIEDTIKADKVNKGVVTDSVYYDDKATSLQEECSKDVQASIDDFGLDTLIEDIAERRISAQPENEKTVTTNELTKRKIADNKNYIEVTNNIKTSSTMLKLGSESEFDKINENKEVQCSDICTLDNFTKEQILGLLTGSCKNCACTGMPSKYHTLPTTKGEQSSSRSNITNIIVKVDKNDKNDNEFINSDSTSNKETSINNLLPERIAAESSTVNMLNSHSEKESTVKLRSNGDKFDSSDFSCKPSTSEITHKERIGDSKSSRHSEESANSMKDPVMDLIKNITRRYSKHDLEDPKRKKCFREIMNVFNYLLNTDDSTDADEIKTSDSATSTDHVLSNSRINSKNDSAVTLSHKDTLDKSTQLHNESKSRKKSKPPIYTEDSSDIPLSSDVPATSDDFSAYRILNRIKRECEKYQRRCKSCRHRQEMSSSTSTHCEKCKWYHESHCRYAQKAKTHKHVKPTENSVNKKCIAYNLIIQASDSMTSHDITPDKISPPLQNIIIKVPSSKLHSKKSEDVSKNKPHSMPHYIEKVRLEPSEDSTKSHRSKSLPNNSETSNADKVMNIREYLEKNRPDFVDRTTKRQDCLKGISESRARKRQAKQQLCEAFSDARVTELRCLAEFLSVGEYKKIDAPKFTSERDMKKHSERIYKTLPEVVRKKEQLKKDRMKKTNSIMAQVFNKNLQKRTLKGSVNISNYSSIIKL